VGFNRRKLEDQRREAAEKEAASRRATDAQVLGDAERLIGAWNEQQAKRMPMLFSPTPARGVTSQGCTRSSALAACRRDIDLRSVALYIKPDANDQRSILDIMAVIDEIIGNFAILDDWDDRYRYLIELGRELPPLAQAAHSDANKVRGCASQVWLDTTVGPNGAGDPVLTFAGDSDAHIVRGLIAILFAIYSGKSAREISNTDAVKLFAGMGLREHLTPQRSNGFRSMVERIRSDARVALAAVA
jgi:cysteine desulfuration protein SufE